MGVENDRADLVLSLHPLWFDKETILAHKGIFFLCCAPAHTQHSNLNRNMGLKTGAEAGQGNIRAEPQTRLFALFFFVVY